MQPSLLNRSVAAPPVNKFCIDFSCHSEPTGERIQLMIADGGQDVRRSSEFRG